MSKDKSIKILKRLEVLRNFSLKKWSNDNLTEDFFLTNFNIFTSSYYFAVTEIVEKIENLNEAYLTYFRTRHTPLRFLIEQYLTIIHVVAMNPEDRPATAYLYLVSGKINIHKLDLKLMKIQEEHGIESIYTQIQEKLEINRRGYRKYLEYFGKLTGRMPDEIDLFFNGTEIIPDCEARFGIRLFRHGKINYTGEIINNPLVPAMLRNFLLINYPLLSLDQHPTYNSVIDFEQFISKSSEEKKTIALGRNSAITTHLNLIGNEMVKIFENILSEN